MLRDVCYRSERCLDAFGDKLQIRHRVIVSTTVNASALLADI